LAHLPEAEKKNPPSFAFRGPQKHQKRHCHNNNNNNMPPGKFDKQTTDDDVRESSSSSSEAQLWKTAVDPNTGRTYYYHVETRETVWRKPLALCTATERAEMERKEQAQRAFFATMEANILKNLQSGAMVQAAEAAEYNFLQTSPAAAAAAPPVLAKPGGLVRTISTMDRQVLSQLVQRQPSHRWSSDTNDLIESSPTDVMAPSLMSSASGAGSSSNFRDSLTAQTQALSLLNDDDDDHVPVRQVGEREASMGTLLSGLPADNETNNTHTANDNNNNASRVSFLGTLQEFAQLDGDGGDDSANGFNISDEEMEALTKLAKMSDQMSSIELEDEEDDTTLEYMDHTTTNPIMPLPSRLSRVTSNARASVRSISLAEVQEEEVEDTTSEVEEEETSPSGPNQSLLAREQALQNMTDGNDTTNTPNVPLPMPQMVRRNTCGTIYVGSTMSAPDKDATIKVRSSCCMCAGVRAC
jgi:hypothetical protein